MSRERIGYFGGTGTRLPRAALALAGVGWLFSLSAGYATGEDEIAFKGFVDAQYVYNSRRPADTTNVLRVFDDKANRSRVNNLELDLAKPVSRPGDSGFRVVLNLGPDADVIAPAGTKNDDDVDVQQAYGEWMVGGGNGIDLKIGKFATLHGAEVIEGRDNDQISRSLLFGYAIPFTHAGVRASTTRGKWTGTLGFINGWDRLNDTRRGVSMEGNVTYAFSPRLSVSLGAMTGFEQVMGIPIRRRLIDTIVTWKPNDDWTLKLNSDFGRDDGVNGWNGLAWYLRYSHESPWALSYRGESFKDLDGSRTGAPQTVGEHTGTLEYRWWSGIIARLEVRTDRSSLDTVFNDRTGLGTLGNQSTVGLQVIAPF